MKRMFQFAVAAILVSFASASAEDIKCGLNKGDEPQPFHVFDVTGASKGSETCYRCQYGDDSVVCIFTTKLGEKLALACKDLDKRLGENKNLKGFVVFVSDDLNAGKEKVKEFAKTNTYKNLPLTCIKAADVKEYKLDTKAETTLVCWKDMKVELTKSYAADQFCNVCCGTQIATFCGDKKTEKSAN